MNCIDELIRKHCPSGVEFKTLGDIARIRNGKDYKSLGQGDVPVYGTGGVMTYVDKAAYDQPSVLIPRKGSLDKLYYVEVPFWTVDTIFYTEIGERLVPKFLYYYLQTQHLEEMNQAGGVPSLTQTALNPLRIPVPPIEVQQEIVKVLDTFSKLEAELEAELAARQIQYTFYRHQLLTFTERERRVRWAKMSEVSTFNRGTAITARQANPGDVPVVANGPVPTYTHSVANRKGETIVVARSGAYAGLVSYWNQPIFLTDAFSVHPDTTILKPKFVYYLLRNSQDSMHSMKKGAGVPHVRVKEVEAYSIPIPPLEEQERIISILDKFDALVNDITGGLPAELDARRQQYEHYRNRLLTFQEAI